MTEELKSAAIRAEAAKMTDAAKQAERYGAAVTEELREKTERGELKRRKGIESSKAVWDLLKGQTVVITYSEHYGINITLNPDGSGKIEDPKREDGAFEFQNWQLGEYAETGKGDYIKNLREAKEFVERVSNTIPSGNLETLGGIPGLVESYLDVKTAEAYYEASQRKPRGDELPWPEFNNIQLPEKKKNKAGLSDAEIEERIENYLFPAKHGMLGLYEQTKWDLQEMAEGGEPEIRAEYYPGWTNDDFKKILKRLEAKEEKLGLR
jgi:hypothetical protein